MALQLHDVRDSEAFVAAIANRSQLELGPDDDEDLRQFLLTELWHLGVRYEPSRNRAFSAYAVAILKRRAVDWQRQRFGRTVWKFKDRVYERPRVENRLARCRRTGRGSRSGQAILRTVATSASQGFSATEIGRGLGTSKFWVCDRLDELRDELGRLSLPE